MFKNAKIYRLTSAGPFWNLDELNDKLATHAFVPGGQLERQTLGWVPPREGADLAHAVSGKIILTLRVESKLLPGKAINQATAARAREIEEQQGYKPGRKQMKEIREQIIDEKLPTALTQYDDIRLWIDPIERWLIIDTSTPSKADAVIGLLAKSIEPFQFENLYVAMSPASAMTGWLAEDEAPLNFTIDQDAELRASGASGAAIGDALAPDGIPGEILAEALQPFNDKLIELSDLAGWRTAAIGADMGITYGGRPYRLLSESERWRVDALIGAALAEISRLRFLILDRFDCLDLPGRGDALGLIDALAADGRMDTILLLGTLKAAPPTPSDMFKVHWIDEGHAGPAKLKEAA